MSDPIAEAVARRWKVAAGYDYLSWADELDPDDALQYYKSDLSSYKGYRIKCLYLIPIFRKIADALETPKILEFASRIEKRVADLDQLMALVGEGVKLIPKAQEEFSRLIDDLVDGKPPRGGLIEAVYDLPSFDAILKLGKEGGKIQYRLTNEDDEMVINWTLEDYVGGEAKISAKLDKNGSPQQGWVSDSFNGVQVLFGFAKYHADSDYIESLVEQEREDRT